MLRTGLATAAAALTVIVAGCGGGGGAIPTATTSTSTSAGGAFDGATFPAGVHAADFTLPDLNGHPVSMHAQRGHVVALVFMPGDCRTCLLVAEQIRGGLDELESHLHRAANVRTILVSTDPAVSSSRLNAFLAKNELLGRVSYLTADEAALRPVWHAYHLTTPNAGRAAAEDAITVLLIDKQGVERVGFGIEQITPEGLSHDIRLLEAQ